MTAEDWIVLALVLLFGVGVGMLKWWSLRLQERADAKLQRAIDIYGDYRELLGRASRGKGGE